MKTKGFTLIEAMIAVAIIGIVAAFAIPGYQDHVARAKRNDGMSGLMVATAAMERHRAANLTYVGAAAGTTFVANVASDGGTAYYNISIGNLTATTYTLTATAIGTHAAQDGSLTIDHQGNKSWVDKDGTNRNCWPEGSSTCS